MADLDVERISSGEVVAESQLAKDNGATVQNPARKIIYDGRTLANVPGAEIQQAFVTGRVNRLLQSGFVSVDNGTANALPLSRSQATPPYDINAFANSPEIDPGGSLATQAASYQAGVGARSDDGVTVTGNSTKDIINATFSTSANQRVYTQPNVLDDYASYTYQISWYLLDPFQYNTLTSSPKANPTGWSLLMQSGGSPIKGRNPRFPVDFYLDDLELLSSMSGRGVGMPHNVTKIKFKVVEPNGLTLINRLYQAVKDFYGPGDNSPELDATGSLAESVKNIKGVEAKSSPPNYANAFYCLAIRFYGYDSGGNLIAPATGRFRPNATPGLVGPTNDTEAIVEKYIAFQILDLKFRTGPGQSSKGIEYFITASPVAMNHAFGQARGSIPFQFELSGTTVSDLLIGKSAQSELKQTFIQEGRVPQASPPAQNVPTALTTQQLGAMAAGTDPNAVTDSGMAFGGGGLTGA